MWCREHRQTHVFARVLLYNRSVALIIFLLCVITYTCIGFDSCSTRVAHLMGFLPLHIIFTAVVISSLILTTPVACSDADRALQVYCRHH